MYIINEINCHFPLINKINNMSIIDKNQLRITHLTDSDAISIKQRHGFFSVPITTAIGDDGPYKTKIRAFLIIKIPAMKWENQKQAQETFRHRLLDQGS